MSFVETMNHCHSVSFTGNCVMREQGGRAPIPKQDVWGWEPCPLSPHYTIACGFITRYHNIPLPLLPIENMSSAGLWTTREQQFDFYGRGGGDFAKKKKNPALISGKKILRPEGPA